MPGYSGEPVVTTLVCLFCFTHEAAGASTPGIPHALVCFRANAPCTTRAHPAARMRRRVLHCRAGMSRRHCEEQKRRSNPFLLRGNMDCFAEPVIGRAFARPVGSQ